MKPVAPLIFQTLLLWMPTRICLAMTHGMRVVKKAPLPKEKKKGLIVVANHTSTKDPFIVTTALPFLSRLQPLFFISMPQKFYKRFGVFVHALMHERLQRLVGGYTVVFGQKNYEATLARHIDILEKGGTLLIFIEGKISEDGTLQSPKPGVGYLVERTGAPVLPIAITNARTKPFKWLRDAGSRLTATHLGVLTKQELTVDAPSDPLARMYHIAESIHGVLENHLTS